MNTWIKIGIRSLFKNKRRALFTMGAIALGYGAVNVFGGFTEYLFHSLEDSYIYAQASGHLTIFKKGFPEYGSMDPASYLLSSNDIARIEAVCRDDSRIEILMPRLHMTGLISDGEISTIYMASGYVPSKAAAIRSRARGLLSKVKLYEGQPLADEDIFGIGVGESLARKLGLSLGSEPVLMGHTMDGQMNLLDAKINFTFDAGAEQLNDKMINVNLAYARMLYDTEGADSLTVLLKSDGDTDLMREVLSQKLAAAGVETEIGTWRELCPSYTKIKGLFNIIFSFVFVIVFVIVVLSVINTVSMAVMERTREIGTLRSLGLKRRGVVTMFATESAILAIMGSMGGILLTLFSWLLVRVAKPTWIPPAVSKRVPLEVYLVPRYLAMALVFMLLLALVAGVLPARRASRMSIIDALGHV